MGDTQNTGTAPRRCRCRGGLHHPWTSESSSSPTSCATRCRSRSCARCMASAAKPATSGSTAACGMGPRAWRSSRGARGARPIRRRRRSSRPSSRRGAGIRRGAARSCWLHKRHPRWPLPGRSTACDILQRQGMVPRRRQRRRIGHPGKPTSQILAPNEVWSADYKGQFLTGDGSYCYPLTAADGFSRYLLGCQALASTAAAEAKPVFTRLFKEYGLPRRMRTDNGVPFATNTLARLSTLSAWWVRLGILPELIEPGPPAQNGRHERMHRTLKAETTRPAAGSLAAQQRRFNVFRAEFNHERPHEALDQETPAACYL